jgi:hypothetical protein
LPRVFHLSSRMNTRVPVLLIERDRSSGLAIVQLYRMKMKYKESKLCGVYESE